MRFLLRVFSTIFWLYLAFSLMVFWLAVVIPWAVITPFDKRRYFAHWYACNWGYHYTLLSPFWRLVILGREKIKNDRASVIVVNHTTAGDILVIYALRKHFKWVSKASVFKVPFLGWMMWMCDYVGIRRGATASRKQMMAECKTHIGRGSAIMMFPEGTRSQTATMRQFRAGAFLLACENKVPITPTVIHRARNVLPRHGFVFQRMDRYPVFLSVLDPIDPARFDYNPRRLMEASREAMQAELDRLEQEYPSPPELEVAEPVVAG